MSHELSLNPTEAWTKYILPALADPKWIEDSDDISKEIGLSKRELLGLILYSFSLDESGAVKVSWSSKDYEPNDGFLDLGDNVCIRCEHKLVPQMAEGHVMEEMKKTFEKKKKKGTGYGENRHLMIQANLRPDP